MKLPLLLLIVGVMTTMSYAFVSKVIAQAPFSTVRVSASCAFGRPQWRVAAVRCTFPRRMALSDDTPEDESSSNQGKQASVSSRAKALPQVHRYRGSVDQGYGRGGKKLGVPTANLPASLFQNALEDVAPGVYFGWAALEHEDTDKDNDNDGAVHKAVVNVGYSPTFEGQENPEKIIEAHLIVDHSISSSSSLLKDFYGIPMRLQLIGFLREEQKFDSFPELIAQINADVQDAKDTLECSPYHEWKQDAFVRTTSLAWVGSGGGDDTASWEFVDMV